MKAGGTDISRHLLLKDVADDPSKLTFDLPTYLDFGDRRFERMWEILQATVDPEAKRGTVQNDTGGSTSTV